MGEHACATFDSPWILACVACNQFMDHQQPTSNHKFLPSRYVGDWSYWWTTVARANDLLTLVLRHTATTTYLPTYLPVYLFTGKSNQTGHHFTPLTSAFKARSAHFYSPYPSMHGWLETCLKHASQGWFASKFNHVTRTLIIKSGRILAQIHTGGIQGTMRVPFLLDEGARTFFDGTYIWQNSSTSPAAVSSNISIWFLIYLGPWRLFILSSRFLVESSQAVGGAESISSSVAFLPRYSRLVDLDYTNVSKYTRLNKRHGIW